MRHRELRGGRSSPAGPGADVAGAVPVQMLPEQSRCRCGSGEHSPGAGAGRTSWLVRASAALRPRVSDSPSTFQRIPSAGNCRKLPAHPIRRVGTGRRDLLRLLLRALPKMATRLIEKATAAMRSKTAIGPGGDVAHLRRFNTSSYECTSPWNAAQPGLGSPRRLPQQNAIRQSKAKP